MKATDELLKQIKELNIEDFKNKKVLTAFLSMNICARFLQVIIYSQKILSLI